MTKEQAEQFLKEVTGRKIRCDGWEEDLYIIPTGKWINQPKKDFFWWMFECIWTDNSKTWFLIREGFSKTRDGDRWEYLEDFEAYLELLDL